MRSTHGSTKGARALVLTLALAAGLVGLAVGLRGQCAGFLAERWRRQLATVPDDRAEALLGQVAQLGESGIPVLVEALGADRECVAKAARQALLSEVDRWTTLPVRKRSPRLAILAAALAEHVDRFGPAAQTDAAELASRILRWPFNGTSVDGRKLIASCETVLRKTAAGRRRMAESRLFDHLKKPSPDDRLAEIPSTTPSRLNDLAGGNPEKSPDHDVEPRVADTRSVESQERNGSSLRQPERLLNEPENAKPILRFHGPAHADHPTALRPISFLNRQQGPHGGCTQDDRQASEWAGVDTFTLMGQLQSGNTPLSANVRRELERRGFTPVDFQLARQLFDPNPEIRGQLARVLPGLSSVDAAPWLLWLSRDGDPSVRRTAIALMATTGDPALLDEIERIARADPDPRVQRQAEQIARQRQATRQ